MLSLQEIFDKGLAHIRRQGEPSVEGSSCRYLCENGNSCIVGGLINPELRQAEFDDAGCTAVEAMANNGSGFAEALFASDVSAHDEEVLTLLKRLQSCHDGAALRLDFMSRFEFLMESAAHALSLTYKAQP